MRDGVLLLQAAPSHVLWMPSLFLSHSHTFYRTLVAVRCIQWYCSEPIDRDELFIVPTIHTNTLFEAYIVLHHLRLSGWNLSSPS